MILSASSVSSRSGRFAATAMVITGDWSLSDLLMTGGRTSRGSWVMAAETRSRTSCVAASMSRSSRNVAMTNEEPGFETERSSSMPSTVLTASSIGCEMSTSISSGEAPGRKVRTNTVGRSTAGKRSTPRPR